MLYTNKDIFWVVPNHKYLLNLSILANIFIVLCIFQRVFLTVIYLTKMSLGSDEMFSPFIDQDTKSTKRCGYLTRVPK